MSKYELLIQLITEGRPGWQVRAEVSKSLCRKMTAEELNRLGTSTVNELAAILHDDPVDRGGAKEAPAEPIATGKKKR